MLARLWRNWTPHILLMRECKMEQPSWKRVWQLLKELNIKPPYYPATLPSVIYPRELKTFIDTKTCTCMFTAELFTKTKGGNKPNIHQLMN